MNVFQDFFVVRGRSRKIHQLSTREQLNSRLNVDFFSKNDDSCEHSEL